MKEGAAMLEPQCRDCILSLNIIITHLLCINRYLLLVYLTSHWRFTYISFATLHYFFYLTHIQIYFKLHINREYSKKRRNGGMGGAKKSKTHSQIPQPTLRKQQKENKHPVTYWRELLHENTLAPNTHTNEWPNPKSSYSKCKKCTKITFVRVWSQQMEQALHTRDTAS